MTAATTVHLHVSSHDVPRKASQDDCHSGLLRTRTVTGHSPALCGTSAHTSVPSHRHMGAAGCPAQISRWIDNGGMAVCAELACIRRIRPFAALLLTRTLSTVQPLAQGFAVVARSRAGCQAALTSATAGTRAKR